MKKIISALAILFVMMFSSSCGKIDQIAHDELTERLLSNVSFSEKLTEIDEISAQKQLFLNPNEYSNITMLVGTRATCEQIIIVDTANETVIDEKLKNYFNNLKSSYASYRPVEADKIGNLFTSVHKGTKVYVVSPDSEKVNIVYTNYIKKK